MRLCNNPVLRSRGNNRLFGALADDSAGGRAVCCLLMILGFCCVLITLMGNVRLGLAAITSPRKTALSTALQVAPSRSTSESEWEDVFGKRIIAKDSVELRFKPSGYPFLSGLVNFDHVDRGDFYSEDHLGGRVYYTVDSQLQRRAEELLKKYSVPWGALVAIEPKTGRILALAGHSQFSTPGADLVMKSGLPAASLFKMITAAAAIEDAGLPPDYLIHFRGGDYTLSRYNALPDPRLDRRAISFERALGKSCNPAFARLALNNLSSRSIERYALYFGFDGSIPFDLPVESSRIVVPSDTYELARTAAGFGEAMLSPLHAALITATIANRGRTMRPHIIDRLLDERGRITYRAEPVAIKSAVLPSTAKQLLEMMESTVCEGTARKQFSQLSGTLRRDVRFAAKTGTLRGENPKGVYHWLVVAAPIEDPTIAVAALVIDPGTARVGGSAIGRMFIEHYFRSR